jgi:purine-nucleoside phosphorylase
MYKQGIEVKRNTDMGVLFEKSSWLQVVEEIYPDTSKRIYYPNDQDYVIHVKEGCTDIAFIAAQGSSMAACMAERLRVYGAKAMVRIGTCGALSKDIIPWVPIITTGCVSDEGTSSHYLPRNFPIIPNLGLNCKLIQTFEEVGTQYQTGITVTTDGRWRENVKLLEKLNQLGVASIEMETAAILAVCHFRRLIGAAINIPTDSPTENSNDDFKGIPDRETYPTLLRASLKKIIPIVVNTLSAIKTVQNE